MHTITASPKDQNQLVTGVLVGVGGRAAQRRPRGIDEPTATGTAKADASLAAIHLTKFRKNSIGSAADEPAPTVTANSYVKRPGGAPPIGVVGAFLTKFSENSVGTSPAEPLHTAMAGAARHGVVSAFLAQYNNHGGDVPNVGRDARDPLSTVTTTGSHQAVVTANLEQPPTFEEWYADTKDLGGTREEYDRIYGDEYIAPHMLNMKGSDLRDAPADDPLRTVTSQGYHHAEVRAFMVKYFGTGVGQEVTDPAHTVTTKDRFGLVTVDIKGEPYIIADIGMRMLSPRELFRAQGFPDTYIIDPLLPDGPKETWFDGERGVLRELPGPKWRRLTKTAQIRMCGNSVCPGVAAAIVRANFMQAYVERQPANEGLFAAAGA